MSTISDWLDDFSGADTNTPQDATAIAYPADGVSDLGFVLRDIKTVARQESLNKGWHPDTLAANRVSNSVFSCADADAADYPAGTAVKMIGGSSNAYGWVKEISGHQFTIKPSGLVTAGFGITGVVFSAILPSSDPDNFDESYPKDIGSALPARMTQWGRVQISGNATVSVGVPLAKTEPDTDYRVLIQPVEVDTGPAANGAYRRVVGSKTTTSFVLTIDTAPGAGTTVYYEYAIFRGE